MSDLIFQTENNGKDWGDGLPMARAVSDYLSSPVSNALLTGRQTLALRSLLR
jgi:hypothetical protein